MKQYLLDKGIDYDYKDITESDEIKAEFYSLREQYSEYAEIIAGQARFGIPAIFYKGEVVIGFKPEEIDKLVTK